FYWKEDEWLNANLRTARTHHWTAKSAAPTDARLMTHAYGLYAVSLVRLGVVIASSQTNFALPHRRGCPWRQNPACLDPRRCRLRTGARAVNRRPPVLPAIGRGTTGSRRSEPRGR